MTRGGTPPSKCRPATAPIVIGQDKPVFVYKIITHDTVEEKILQLQEKKRALVKSIISSDAGFFKSLTKDDVRMLFE